MKHLSRDEMKNVMGGSVTTQCYIRCQFVSVGQGVYSPIYFLYVETCSGNPESVCQANMVTYLSCGCNSVGHA
jgi:hypothetical protein